MTERLFMDGTGITEGCKCGPECEFSCWMRVGQAPACKACGCAPFEEDPTIEDLRDAVDILHRAANRPERPRLTARPPQPTERPATAKQRGLINAKAGEKRLPALVLLNTIRAVNGEEPASVDDEQARAFLRKAMDRLPKSHVSAVLEVIEACDQPEDLPL